MFRNVQDVEKLGMTFNVPVQVKTRAALAWVHFCKFLSYLVGEDIAIRWAESGAWYLARYRIGTTNGKVWGSWRRFDRQEPSDQELAAAHYDEGN